VAHYQTFVALKLVVQQFWGMHFLKELFITRLYTIDVLLQLPQL
jgi:hypothetical protein